MKKELGLLGLLVVLCILTPAVEYFYVSPGTTQFFSGSNMTNIAVLVGMYGIFSIGEGLIIITSGIDLSVGSFFALLGVVFATILPKVGVPVALISMILLGVGVGLMHGLLIARVGMQPFIVTLCGLLIYRGLARFVTGDETRGFGDETQYATLKSYTTGSWLSIPMTLWYLFVIAIIAAIVLHLSVYGRHLYAVGRNDEAARYSGINTKAVVTLAYVIGGLLSAISGILVALNVGSIAPSNHATFYELYGIAGAVLGGCSLRGGEGSIFGIVLGTIVLLVLQNLVLLLGIPDSLTFAVVGAVIFIGVLVDQLLKKRPARVGRDAPVAAAPPAPPTAPIPAEPV